MKTPTLSKLFVLALIGLWSSPQAFAAQQPLVAHQTAALVEFGSTLFSVVRNGPIAAGYCNITCTSFGYSFCLDETPGCLEGWMDTPDSAFKGNIGPSFTNESVLTLQATISSSLSGPGVAWWCYAFDANGNCTDLTYVTGLVGYANLTFTKSPVSDSVTRQSSCDLFSDNTPNLINEWEIINYSFTASVFGEAIGTPVNQPSTSANPGGSLLYNDSIWLTQIKESL